MRSLIALVAPPLCGVCGAPASTQTILCPTCKGDLYDGHGVHLNLPGISAWAARPYEGIARDLIAGLKFASRLRLAGTAAELIATDAPPQFLLGAVVPVPPSPLRSIWRGFDPAGEIARALARRVGLELHPCLRRENARRQVGRPRDERISNPPRVRVHGQPPDRVLLVDDVITTGATLGACAAALRQAGSGHVAAVAFAAAPLGKSTAEA